MSSPTVPVRIVMDVTTCGRWVGPDVGIVRVERRLADWARRACDGGVFVVFDPRDQIYRSVEPRWMAPLLAAACTLQDRNPPDAAQPRRHFLDRVPAPLRPAASWALQFRRQALASLEDWRLTTSSERTARLLDRAQRAFMTEKYQRLMVRPDGSRRDQLHLDIAAPRPHDWQSGDIFVCAGSPWGNANVRVLAALKQRHGFRFAMVCHDIIPLLFPQFYKPGDVAAFGDYHSVAFGLADLVLCATRTVERDAHDYCRKTGLALGRTAIVPFGADAVAGRASAEAVPRLGLTAGRFILLVGTIEPRKGHRLMLQVWQRLMAAGMTQCAGWKLVFVGRRGWMVDELLADIDAMQQRTGTLLALCDLDDALLSALYEDAAFCVYPSLYEGYGLPIVEAFLHGRAVIASRGGAIPEVVGDLSLCIDADDGEAWYETIVRWIEDPSERRRYEDRLHTCFQRTTWDEAACAVFEAIVADADPRRLPATATDVAPV